MKKLLASLLILLLAVPAPTLAALSESDRAIYTQRNFLINPGAESSTAGVVASTPAHFGTTSSAGNVDSGNASFFWAPTAANETVTFGFYSITSGGALSGSNGTVSCRFKSAGAINSHTIQGWDGTNKYNPQTITTSASSFQRTSTLFTFPASGNITLQITSGAADTVYFDGCYLGLSEGLNSSQVSQAQLLGTITPSGCSANFTTTSTSMAAFPTNSGCSYTTTGSAQAPATQVPGIKFASLAPGDYLLQYEGSIFQQGTAKVGQFRFTDGTNNARETSVIFSAAGQLNVPGITQSISYSTAQSNVTLQIYGQTDSGGTTALVANGGVIKVYFFPSQSQLAYTAANGGLAPGDITASAASSCPIGTVAADGTSYLRTTFPALFTAIGTTYGAADGTHFNVPDYRGLFLRGVGTNATALQSNGGAVAGAALGTLQNDMFQSHYHDLRVFDGSSYFMLYGTGSGSGAGYFGRPVTEFPNTSNTGNIPDQARDLISDGTNGTPRVGAETRPANLSATYCIRTVPATAAPVLVGSVTSNTSGQERVERARITCSGSSSINEQSGTWISSISNVSSGVCTLTLPAGEFSAVPDCVATAVNGTSSNLAVGLIVVNSTTSVTVGCQFFSSGSSTINTCASPVNVICMGPR